MNLIATGNTAKIYLYGNLVVKVFNENLPDSESFYEAHKQKYVHSLGLRVPEVLEVRRIEGKQAIIMEYIEGPVLGDLLSRNSAKKNDYMDLFVKSQRKVHSINTGLLEHMSDKLHCQIDSANNLDQNQKLKLLAKLESLSCRDTSLCHGDFHPYNLIMGIEGVAIIDWVDAGSGDIRADVCRTYLLYSQFSVDMAELYLNSYCEASGLSEEEIFKWAPVIAGARLAENVSSENKDRLIELVDRYS